VNIVSEERLDERITIHLEDVSFEDGLKLLLETQGLTYEKEKDVYRVRRKIKPPPYTISVSEGLLTLKAYKADIDELLREISKLTDINVVVDRTVKGEVSIYIKEAPVESALVAILETGRIPYKKTKDIYLVGEIGKREVKKHIVVKDGKLSLDLKDVDILVALREISIQSGLNIVADKSVTGKVTSRIDDVDVEKGLRSLLETNGFSCEKVNDIYQVRRLDTKRTFQISVAEDGLISVDVRSGDIKDILRTLSLRTGVNIAVADNVRALVNANIKAREIEDVLTLLLHGTNFTFKKIGDTFMVGEGLSLKPSSLAFTTSKVIKINWLDAEETIKIIPPIFPKNNIQLLKDQNALAVVGTEDLISRLEDYIEKIDKPAPQIMIEALVVEFKRDYTRNIGVTSITEKVGVFEGVLEKKLLPGTLEPLTLVYKIDEDSREEFTLALQALIREGQAEVKAKPRIATLNGHEASIDVVTKYRYREHRYNEQTGRLEPVGVPREIEAGIKLKIKPWVTASRDIIVEITPEVSSRIGSTETDTYALPITSERKAKTTIRVKDGETIIIGGLIQTEERETINRIPLLGRIPILGYLFSKREKIDTQTELVFYITPRLIGG
jgi:type IV pilus assembly protein PilQ